MGSSRGNCEIVEAKDEPSTTSRPDRDQRPPIVKKNPNYKSLEDDINKLFESVNLRASKSLDLSDSWRKASKRPIRGVGSHSSAIGFSQPVSLKQSLRGLCISQAAEMAAMKRLSVPSSPRISEAGKITNLYRSVVESSGSAGPTTESSCSSPCINATPSIKSTQSLKQSANTCPHFPISVNIKDAESSLAHKDIVPLSVVDTQAVETIHVNAFDNVLNPKEEVSGLKKAVIEDSASRSNKAAFKLRRKLRPTVPSSSSAVKSNKETKSAKITSRTVKPVIRSKPVVIKKSKKVAVSVSTGGDVKVSREVNNSNFFCQRCQCSLKDSDKDHYVNTLADVASNIVPSRTIKTKKDSKSSEKGDITQSSKSSDFSSSTTSLSEESNLSGLIFGNRPHMSKDMRWGAVDCIRKQYGFLGLSHFNLLKKLGSGDIGTVYLAELIRTNCVFAIKVMDNEFLGRRKKLPRAQTEREILRMLDHPFLPTLYAQFTSDNLSCLVMEFCPGGDLHVLRQKQPDRYFPEQAARFYVAEVLLALEYLHMLGIVYRDLKPENILVREDGHIMLTDFDLSLRCSVNPILVKSSSLGGVDPPRISGPCAGSNCIDPFCTGPSCKLSLCFSPRLFPASARARKLKADVVARARSLHQLVAEPTEARSNSFVGTHEYLAPEIIKGEGHGSSVDWWTFGVFLYELLYGKTPFIGANNDETLDNVVLQNNLRFPDFPIVSFHARDLIRGLLVKEPENRLGTETGSAEIKRHPFFDGLNWALIRCASPPEVPELHDVGKVENKFMDCSVDGEHLEFELF